MNSKNQKREGTIEADTVLTAKGMLREKGLIVQDISEITGAAAGESIGVAGVVGIGQVPCG